MKINPVNNIGTQKSQRIKAARNGALLTSGILAASAGISWATRPGRMGQIVNEYGGFKNYIKTFAIGLVMLSAIGAATNTIVTAIAQKVKPQNPPKAVN